ncbi:MAG: RNA 3'-terminal phosphate cyclase [Desulfobulbaceae bacterium]|nr:RNA 3'-terminal phosphate cyclase [Desulfobulbaceae bacterium]
MEKHIVIDGSIGEGGGQILRTSLSLAALTQRSFEIHSIRANRRHPGLRPQHLAAVRAVAQITGAEVAGDSENATSLRFAPRTIQRGSYRFTIGTAGSVTLLAASILPPLLFAAGPSTIVLQGGTHVPFSPVFHYLQENFLPFLRRMGGEASAVLDKWGWYPGGGGSCTLRVTPCPGLKGLQVPERGRLRRLDLMLGLANLPLHIVDREEKQLRACLGKKGYEFARRFEPAPSPGQGNVLYLRGEYENSLAGFSVLGKKGKPAEQVAQELCRAFLHFAASAASVDKHLADQLLLYMALARGNSMIITEEVTGHLTTGIGIIEKFIPVRFKLDPDVRSVEVTGAAYTPGIRIS